MADEIKVIYHVNDEDTPYLIKLPINADRVTLGDLKNALQRPNYKYFFKSMDDDFGVVKEEIWDDNAHLPCFNGRVVSWLIASDGSTGGTSDTHSQCTESVAGDQTKEDGKPSPSCTSSQLKKAQSVDAGTAATTGDNSKRYVQGGSVRHPITASPRANLGGGSSVMSSDIETTSFVDSDDDASSRVTENTETTTNTTSRHDRQRQQQRRRRHKLPVMSHASSFSSITDSTMSLNIITVTLNMDLVNFLGISIVGHSNKGGDGGIYVGSIMKGGAVALDGRIEPGDMILEVNGISFENLSNDEAVRTLREVVHKSGPVKLVIAKCWDPNPSGYLTSLRHEEPSRPIDPSAWVAHTEAVRTGTPSWGAQLDPSLRGTPAGWGVGGGSGMQGGGFYSGIHPFSDITSTASSSIISSVTGGSDYERNFAPALTPQPVANSTQKSYEDIPVALSVHTDMALVARAVSRPDSGLEVRDRMWLKIVIPHAFIGSDLVDWLHSHVEGLSDRRDARKYASNMLRAGFVRHTVNKLTFSEQCYYVFDNINTSTPSTGAHVLSDFGTYQGIGDYRGNGYQVIGGNGDGTGNACLPGQFKNLSSLTLEDIDSVSEVNQFRRPLPTSASCWVSQFNTNPYGPTPPPLAPVPHMVYAPPPSYNFVTGYGGGGVRSGSSLTPTKSNDAKSASGSSASGSSRSQGGKGSIGGGKGGGPGSGSGGSSSGGGKLKKISGPSLICGGDVGDGCSVLMSTRHYSPNSVNLLSSNGGGGGASPQFTATQQSFRKSIENPYVNDSLEIMGDL